MSRLYIRVLTGFFTHRKTVRLRQSLGDDALWIMPRIWAYAAENQPDGDLSSYTGPDLAELIGCSKHATSMLQALKNSGYMDDDGRLHDWQEHNGYHQKYSERAKKAAAARWGHRNGARTPQVASPPAPPLGKRKEESGDKHCLSNATSIPRFKKPTIDEILLLAVKAGLPDIEARKFFNYYESNGWRVGRNPMKSIPHAIANWKLNAQSYGRTNKQNSRPGDDRNRGTLNEGKASQYRGLGKVVPVPHLP